MFDIAPSELLLLAVVALVVIGPKELPRVMRTVGHWMGRARAMANQFKSGLDEMVREAELAEMEQHWKAENERIMREHRAAMAGLDGEASSSASASAQPALPAPADPAPPALSAPPAPAGDDAAPTARAADARP